MVPNSDGAEANLRATGGEAGAGDKRASAVRYEEEHNADHQLVLMLLVFQSVTTVRFPRKGNGVMRDTWT